MDSTNRADPPPRTLENQGGCGACHAGMDGLVQPSPTARAHRLYPTGRSRGKLLPQLASQPATVVALLKPNSLYGAWGDSHTLVTSEISNLMSNPQ